MAGKINSRAVIDKLQRSMALKESGAEGPYYSKEGHAGCAGHRCNAACGYHGYCDFEATRYYYNTEGSHQGTANKGERHDYYKRRMRLGYDSSDY